MSQWDDVTEMGKDLILELLRKEAEKQPGSLIAELARSTREILLTDDSCYNEE